MHRATPTWPACGACGVRGSKVFFCGWTQHLWTCPAVKPMLQKGPKRIEPCDVGWHRQHLGQNQPYMAHASYVEGLRRATANTADKEYVMNAKSLNLVAVCKRPSIPPARWLCLQLPLCSWLVLLWMIHGLQRELCTNSCLQMSSYVDNFWLQQVKLRLLRSCFAVGSKVDSLCCSN